MSACATCKAEIMQTGRGHPRIYCSRPCSKGAHPYAPVTCARCGSDYRTHAEQPTSLCKQCRSDARRFDRGLCRLCGAPIPWQRGHTGVYCGPEHRALGHKRTTDQNHDKNHKRRAAKFGVGYERFSSEDIFERDGWRCHICRKKVHPSRFKRDPEGPSLDHVIPLADGGTHSRANCRLAHLRCNAARGRRGNVQLLLLG